MMVSCECAGLLFLDISLIKILKSKKSK